MGLGPVCFATPELQCSHPTARGQSRPHHIRERGGFLIIFKGAERVQIFQKGVWVFLVENLSMGLSSPFCFLQGCWEVALQSDSINVGSSSSSTSLSSKHKASGRLPETKSYNLDLKSVYSYYGTQDCPAFFPLWRGGMGVFFNQPRRQCPDQPKQTQSMALTENKGYLLIFTVEKIYIQNKNLNREKDK